MATISVCETVDAKPIARAEGHDVTPDIKELRAAIPAHCFERSTIRSLSYVVRDLVLVGILAYCGFCISKIDDKTISIPLWALYSLVQGFVFTGLWILAHECGHDSFSPHLKLNSTIGFAIHSLLLVPFFSWRFSHARHHRYTNHIDKDTVFSPHRRESFRATLLSGSWLGYAEDSPLVSLVLLAGHQLVGWPAYMLCNVGAGTKSDAREGGEAVGAHCHYVPGASVFTDAEHPYVVLSNIGIVCVGSALIWASTVVGWSTVLLMYGLPYLWMNHWIVAITFLHHTHPDAHRYEHDAWNYRDGALQTIDRDLGFVGRHMFHGIIEYHVIHHLFPRIPFYHAEEATKAVAPLLGQKYKQQKTSFLGDLYSTFRQCRFVDNVQHEPGKLAWHTANE